MIRGLLLDSEGVLYQSGRTLAGAADAVRELTDADLKIRYLTSTTTQSRRTIVERLRSMGFFVDPHRPFTPSAAACRLLEQDGIRRLHLATPAALCEDFAVFDLVEADPEGVVMGDLHEGFTWHRLNQLFQMLRSGARRVALHRNRYCRRESGISLDLGPFVAALEYAGCRLFHVNGCAATAAPEAQLEALAPTLGASQPPGSSRRLEARPSIGVRRSSSLRASA